MGDFVIQVMNQMGYLGVALLIAIENIFPPIPSEIILTFAGFMTITAGLDPWLMILSATIGSVVGAIVLYFIGRIFKVERINKILSGKVGMVIHLSPLDLKKALNWFDKYGYFTVFLCRFIPLIRSLISLPAGIAKMNFPIFLGLTVLGTSIWNGLLIWAGIWAKDSWDILAEYLGIYSKIVGIILLIIFAFGIIIILKRKQK